MSLIAEKYRRHRSKLKSPITDATVKVYQLILMSSRDAMVLYTLPVHTKDTSNGQVNCGNR
jgi:hypothetical protein